MIVLDKIQELIENDPELKNRPKVAPTPEEKALKVQMSQFLSLVTVIVFLIGLAIGLIPLTTAIYTKNWWILLAGIVTAPIAEIIVRASYLVASLLTIALVATSKTLFKIMFGTLLFVLLPLSAWYAFLTESPFVWIVPALTLVVMILTQYILKIGVFEE